MFYALVAVLLIAFLGVFAAMAERKTQVIDPKLTGVKGWLAVYRIYVWVCVGHYALRTAAMFLVPKQFGGTGFDVLALILLIYIGITLGKRQQRTLLLARTYEAVAIVLPVIVLLTDSAEWIIWGYYMARSAIDAVWLIYLIRSRRVNATFGAVAAPAQTDGAVRGPAH